MQFPAPQPVRRFKIFIFTLASCRSHQASPAENPFAAIYRCTERRRPPRGPKGAFTLSGQRQKLLPGGEDRESASELGRVAGRDRSRTGRGPPVRWQRRRPRAAPVAAARSGVPFFQRHGYRPQSHPRPWRGAGLPGITSPPSNLSALSRSRAAAARPESARPRRGAADQSARARRAPRPPRKRVTSRREPSASCRVVAGFLLGCGRYLIRVREFLLRLVTQARGAQDGGAVSRPAACSPPVVAA